MSIHKKLLKEELSRFNSLMEYNYIGEKEDVYNDMDKIDDVILSEVPGDEPKPNDSDEKKDDEENTEDAPIDLDGIGDEEEGTDFGDEADGGFGADDADGFGGDEGFDDGGDFSEEPEEEAIEVDITQLVQDNEATKSIANSANQKMDTLMQKFAELQGSLVKMDGISKQISSMEADIDKRMPSEEEKLEMRSLDSFPYSVKLTDYWSEKEGKYDVMNTDEEEEYVLTHDDVVKDLHNNSVKDSFNDFEEEEFTV